MKFAPLDPASDVVDDPDFNVLITVLRDTQTIGPGGLAQIVAQTPGGVIINAIVTPDPGRQLILNDAGAQIQADIRIVTRFPLTEGGAGLAADDVIYAGRKYRIMRTQPYTFGTGWTRAQALMTSINPSAADIDPSTPKAPSSGGFVDR